MLATLLVLFAAAPAHCLLGGATVRHRSRAAIVATAEEDGPLTATRFLKDLEFLGPCRFVVVGPGSILEATGAFDNLRQKEGLATVSNDDNSFECHIRLAQVKSAQFATKDSGERVLHIVRLLGEDGKSLLSAILHPEDGEVDPGAIEFWTSLKNRFGEEPTFASEESS